MTRKKSISVVVDTIILAFLVGLTILFCSWVAWHRGYDVGWEAHMQDDMLGRPYR